MSNQVNSNPDPINSNLGQIGSALIGNAKETSLKEYVSVISSTGLNRVWTQLKLLSKGKGWISENSIKNVKNDETLNKVHCFISTKISNFTNAKETNRSLILEQAVQAANKSSTAGQPAPDKIDVRALIREADKQNKIIKHLQEVNNQIQQKSASIQPSNFDDIYYVVDPADSIGETLENEIDESLENDSDNKPEKSRLSPTATELKHIDISEWKMNNLLYNDFTQYIFKLTNIDYSRQPFDQSLFDNEYENYLNDLAKRMKKADKIDDSISTEFNRLIELNQKLALIPKDKQNAILTQIRRIGREAWNSNLILNNDYLAFVSKMSGIDLRAHQFEGNLTALFDKYNDSYIMDLMVRIATDDVTIELKNILPPLLNKTHPVSQEEKLVNKSTLTEKSSSTQIFVEDQASASLKEDINTQLNAREKERLTNLKLIDKSEWSFSLLLSNDFIYYCARLTNHAPDLFTFDKSLFNQMYDRYLADLTIRMQKKSAGIGNDKELDDPTFTELNRLIELNQKLTAIPDAKLSQISDQLNSIDKNTWESNQALRGDYEAYVGKFSIQSGGRAKQFINFHIYDNSLYNRYIKDLAQRIAMDTITEELRTAFNTLKSTG